MQISRSMKYFLYLICFISVVFGMHSCRSIKYVPIETVKTDSIYINKIQYDSVFHHDSIYVQDKGDTVFLYKERYIYKYQNTRDTLLFTKTDSIKIPYPVEKQLSKWQQLKIHVGGWAIGIVIITILIVFGIFVYKMKK